MNVIEAYVLAVGLGRRSDALLPLPIRLFTADCAEEAIRILRTEKVDVIASQWELDGMANGMFLKQIQTARPEIPIVAFIEIGNYEQEVAARGLGITVVVDETISSDDFREMICLLLRIPLVVKT